MSPTVPGNDRDCGTCSLCCKLVGIEALDKPVGQWCPHAKPGRGCAIYDRRPLECRDFSCLWLENDRLGEEWRPSRSKIVLYRIDDGRRLVAHLDTGSPGAWRQEPYYSQLKAWARGMASGGPQVVVRIGDRIIAILPNSDVDLGPLSAGDIVFIGAVMTPAGPDYVARKLTAAEVAAAHPGGPLD
ncbi:MAG: hypothetical protein U1E56_09700 [Bauldia sp.]